jgi:predicted small lipoprotein YifL
MADAVRTASQMTHNLLCCAKFSESALSRPDRSPSLLAVIGVMILALPLAACGRKGALDPPPGGYVLEQQGPGSTPTSRTGAQPFPDKPPEYDAEGRPTAPQGLKKKLPGDWLID